VAKPARPTPGYAALKQPDSGPCWPAAKRDDRGLVGTLFNGNSNKYMRKDLLPTDPGIAVPQFDSGGTEQARIA
jgi:hypothetical protein